MKHLPLILIGIRCAIALLLLFDALNGSVSNWFIIGYVIAFLSDIFDGIIARKLGNSTPQLRQADSWADVCLYICIGLSIWLIYPTVVKEFAFPLAISIAVQLFLYLFSWLKFGKFPSFHTYTAKVWGITLFIATIGLFGWGYTLTIWLAIVCCWVNTLEEIIMTVLLRKWQHDVLSIFQAWELRNN